MYVSRNSGFLRPVFLLAGGIVLVVAALILQNLFLRQYNNEYLEKKFQIQLEKKQATVEALFQKMKETDPEAFFIEIGNSINESDELYREKGIALAIYDNDSLKYWSTSAVPFSPVPLEEPEFDGVKRLAGGWYYIRTIREGNRVLKGMILIKNEYPFENKYLKNNFQKEFEIPEGTGLVMKQGRVSFTFSGNKQLPPVHQNALFIVYLAALVLFILSLYHLYLVLEKHFRQKLLFWIFFVVDVLVLRILLIYFQVPRILYTTPLFGPTLFSSSWFFPSLGDLLVNSLLFLFIAYIIYLRFPVMVSFKKQSILRSVETIVIVLMTGALVSAAIYMIRMLVLNSSIPMSLHNIAGLSTGSLTGYGIVAMIFLSVSLLAYRLAERLTELFTKGDYSYHDPNVRIIIIFLVLCSITGTLVISRMIDRKEHDSRKLLAFRIGSERDPVAEMLFSDIEKEVVDDSVPFLLLTGVPSLSGIDREDSLEGYIRQRYFRASWNNYFIQVTLCSGDKILRIQPQNYLAGCDSFFNHNIRSYGKPTISDHLYFMDYGYGTRNYLAVIPLALPGDDRIKMQAYIEISSRLVFKDLGYPELLVDERLGTVPDISGYSYAFYRNGKLVNRMGPFNYSNDLDHILSHDRAPDHFYNDRGMSHYCHSIDKDNILIISRAESTFPDVIAPFSYLFIFLSFFLLIFSFVVRFPAVSRLSFVKLATRFQLSMIGVIVISLVLVGGIILFYVIRLNTEKNLENLNERAHSILIELQHKIGSSENLDGFTREELNELLIKYSNVFFTDVNLYSPDGRLLSTSRPQVFEEGLISGWMNTKALMTLGEQNSSRFFHYEYIGSYRFASAYIPFYNDRNNLLGYLNLPYFARQEDMKREISSFLVAFINSYVLLILTGLLVALIVSSYISRPIRLLTSRIGNVTLDGFNEKLSWKRNDEIGKLVEGYNRMIDELGRKAELLARSERETAWREMARQIAHEIKNPLTPMKLSVQYLMKAWSEKAPDWEERLKRFTLTMTEQIESLAVIASDFSDFAKMPLPVVERLNLEEIIKSAVSLYQDQPIPVSIESEGEGYPVMADRKQLSRVFTNLINNSIQAIGDQKEGKIKIRMTTSGSNHLITVEDNGSGIPEEMVSKIFQPNFTTKTGGMGLGLAIVKNIITASGGEITFSSEQGQGTVFAIVLPSAGK